MPSGAMRLGPVGVSLSGEYDQIGGYDIPSDPDIVNAQIGGEDSLHATGSRDRRIECRHARACG